jgi:hypothetical protein
MVKVIQAWQWTESQGRLMVMVGMDGQGWSIEAQDPTVFRYTSNMLQAYFKHA